MKTALRLLSLLCLLPSISYGQEMPNFFGVPPIEYKDTEYLALSIKASPEFVKRLVPAELEFTDSSRVQLTFVKVILAGLKNGRDSEFHEVVLSVPNMGINGKRGGFAHILFLDQAAGIVGGREIWGFPKVNGEITFEKKENELFFELRRYDELLISGSAVLDTIIDTRVRTSDKGHGFVLKSIPSVTGSETPALKRLNSWSGTDIRVWDVRGAAIEAFEYHPSDQNFLPDLGTFEIVNVLNYKFSGLLGYGEVEHDYLIEE